MCNTAARAGKTGSGWLAAASARTPAPTPVGSRPARQRPSAPALAGSPNPAKNRPHRTDPDTRDAAPGEKGSMNPYNQRRQPARLSSWAKCARRTTAKA